MFSLNSFFIYNHCRDIFVKEENKDIKRKYLSIYLPATMFSSPSFIFCMHSNALLASCSLADYTHTHTHTHTRAHTRNQTAERGEKDEGRVAHSTVHQILNCLRWQIRSSSPSLFEVTAIAVSACAKWISLVVVGTYYCN